MDYIPKRLNTKKDLSLVQKKEVTGWIYVYMHANALLTRSEVNVRREWPSGQSTGLWVGRPGFESWMGHYVVALSKSLHSPCFVFSDKTLSRRSRLLQGLG